MASIEPSYEDDFDADMKESRKASIQQVKKGPSETTQQNISPPMYSVHNSSNAISGENVGMNKSIEK